MKVLLILLFAISSYSVRAEEICIGEEGALVPRQTSELVRISEKLCDNGFNDKFYHLATGCLKGLWDTGEGAISGLYDLGKFIAYTGPKWIINKTSERIKEISKSDQSIFEISKSIAQQQREVLKNIYTSSPEYLNEFKKFTADLKDQLVNEIDGFSCLSTEKQSEIVCEGVSTVFLTVLGPGAFINGARFTANTSSAILKFAQETKKMNGLSDLDFSSRMNYVTDHLKRSTAARGVVTLPSGELKTIQLPDGTEVMHLTKVIKGKDGKSHLITREVPLDAKTKAIDANSEIGKEILAEFVKSNNDKGSLIFIDINHLGKVNYFEGGTQVGDNYLSSVGDSLRKALRDGDMIFKNGGDELVVVVNQNNAKTVKAISDRMVKEVDSNPVVREIFRNEVKLAADKYRSLNSVKSFDEMPTSVRHSLTVDEMKEAQRDFESFKRSKLALIKTDIQDQATYRGSISIGSSKITNNESLSDVLTKAEAQASRVKTEYKLRMGHDVSKYKMDDVRMNAEANKWTPPITLMPE